MQFLEVFISAFGQIFLITLIAAIKE